MKLAKYRANGAVFKVTEISEDQFTHNAAGEAQPLSITDSMDARVLGQPADMPL